MFINHPISLLKFICIYVGWPPHLVFHFCPGSQGTSASWSWSCSIWDPGVCLQHQAWGQHWASSAYASCHNIAQGLFCLFSVDWVVVFLTDWIFSLDIIWIPPGSAISWSGSRSRSGGADWCFAIASGAETGPQQWPLGCLLGQQASLSDHVYLGSKFNQHFCENVSSFHTLFLIAGHILSSPSPWHNGIHVHSVPYLHTVISFHSSFQGEDSEWSDLVIICFPGNIYIYFLFV